MDHDEPPWAGRSLPPVAAKSIGAVCAILGAALWVLVAWFGEIYRTTPEPDKAIPIFLGFLVPLALFFTVVGVRAILTSERELLSLCGWRIMMLSNLALAAGFGILVHPASVLLPLAIVLFILLYRDPWGKHLRALLQ